jgi:hypothetical protein
METLALDGDSALPNLLASREDARHLLRAGDPGHLKKNFIRSLKKLFGQKKAFEGMAERFGRFYMWSAKKAIALFPGDYRDLHVREARRAEFQRRFGHCLDHYTNKECLPTCPCHEAGAAPEERTSLDLLQQAILEALQESPAEGEAVIVEPDGEPAIVVAEALDGDEEEPSQGEGDEAAASEEEESEEAAGFIEEEEDEVEEDGEEEAALMGRRHEDVGESEEEQAEQAPLVGDDDEFIPRHEDADEEISVEEGSYEDEEALRPKKKRRLVAAMPIATPVGLSAVEVLQIDPNASRVACHYEKKWLDLSLGAVVFIAPRLKALVVRLSFCPHC